MEWGPPAPPVPDAPECLYFGSDLSARIHVIAFGGGWYALVAEERLGQRQIDFGGLAHISAGLWNPINRGALRRVSGWSGTNYRTLFHQIVRGKKNIKKRAMTLAASYRLQGLA